MDAKQRVGLAFVEIERPGAEGVARTSRHAPPPAPRLAVARLHLRRGIPGGPFGLSLDGGGAGPCEAVPTHRDAISPGHPRSEDEIKETRIRIDHDRARLLRACVAHELRQKLRLDLCIIRIC